MKRNDFGLGINNGDRGRVLAVDPERQSLLIESDGRQVRLGRDFLCEPTGRGDPSLLHGYAITCHVAQGVTVDQAHVLADRGFSRELAYTALSRGRHANHIYTTREPGDRHAEIGPTDSRPRDPITRLSAALKTSAAKNLAIDAAPVDLAEAEHRHQRAVAARRAIEQSRWRPGRRHRLAAAHE